MPKPHAISVDPIARLAERQHWITPQAQVATQSAIRSAFEDMGEAGQTLRSVLHGDWLNEPLHAVLTDIPVGAWTAAVLFDAIGVVSQSDKLNTAADASVIVGLVGAVGAAVTGMNDWAEVKQPAARRIGAVHGLLNIGATALFTASCIGRRQASSRSNARALAVLGFVLVGISAHLGGNLVYEHGVGVTRGKQPAR